jgi:hypothetical protein
LPIRPSLPPGTSMLKRSPYSTLSIGSVPTACEILKWKREPEP